MADRPEPPNPGSREAVARGCKCPVMDNGYGRGYLGQPGVYVTTESCPLHGALPELPGAEGGE